MHTSFACTLQMLTCTFLGFATHNICTHMQVLNTHARAHIWPQVFKHLESSLRGRYKSRVIERPNLHYAGLS